MDMQAMVHLTELYDRKHTHQKLTVPAFDQSGKGL